jgi:hypothetical protein
MKCFIGWFANISVQFMFLCYVLGWNLLMFNSYYVYVSSSDFNIKLGYVLGLF